VTVNSGFNSRFRKRLDELRAFSKHSKGIHFHPGNIRLGFDRRGGQGESRQTLEAHIQLLKEAEPATGTPYVPSRTAGLPNGRFTGPSGPLGWEPAADQMGLGKPCRRWLSSSACPWGPTPLPHFRVHELGKEAQRFAPTLNIVQFGGSDRQQLPTAYNRLICWYAATVCSRKKCPKCCPRCSGKRLCWTKPRRSKI